MADESKASAAELTPQAAPGPSLPARSQCRVTAAPGSSLFLYGRGNSVVVRDAENPSLAFVHTAHRDAVTVAVMSPCGQYVASGDNSGNVKVWTFTSPVTMYKELDGVVGAQVCDLAWNAASTRLAIVGNSTKGSAVVMDLETGEVVVSCSKKQDAYTVTAFQQTGDERMFFANNEGSVGVYGPEIDDEGDAIEMPWEDAITSIRGFRAKLYCMALSPDGSTIVVGLANGTLHVYDESYTEVAMIEKAHGTSGVYAVSFSADGSQFVSHAADKNIKVWDTASRKCVATITIGEAREHMQVGGVVTSSGTIVSVSKDGSLSFIKLDALDGDVTTYQSLEGKPVAVACGPRDESGVASIFAAFSGGIMRYASDGSGSLVSSVVSRTSVSSLAVGAKAFAGVQGNKVVFGSLENGEITSTVELDSRIVAVSGRQLGDNFVVAAVTEGKNIVTLANGEKKHVLDRNYEPSCVDVAPDGSRVVVGSEDKKKVHTFLLEDDFSLAKNKATGPNPAGITAVAVSPDGASIAYGDAGKDVRVVDADTKKAKMIEGLWTNHNARILSVAWNPSSDFVATTGLTDIRVRTWSLATQKKSKAYKVPSYPLAVEWISDTELFAIDNDGIARAMKTKH